MSVFIILKMAKDAVAAKRLMTVTLKNLDLPLVAASWSINSFALSFNCLNKRFIVEILSDPGLCHREFHQILCYSHLKRDGLSGGTAGMDRNNWKPGNNYPL